MTPSDAPTIGEVRYRLEDHDRRLAKVEAEADDIAVMKVKIDLLTERVRVMTAALWSVAGALVLVAVSVILKSGGFG
jgi:hypothetical protein